MSKIRTIKAAHEEIKMQDPNTALTEFRIRQMVISGEIPSRKAGRKYLIDVDNLSEYMHMKRYFNE